MDPKRVATQMAGTKKIGAVSAGTAPKQTAAAMVARDDERIAKADDWVARA
jgi:hypothetical protein